MRKIEKYIYTINLFLSLIILSFNLYYFILYKKNSFLLRNFNFENISKTLKIVYKTIKDASNKSNKKEIHLFFEDITKNQTLSFLNLLKENFIIKITPKNPDYLIYSVFGCHHKNKKYINSIKIAYFTENQIPDFNMADYAIGQAHINYLDRYFIMPINFKFFININNTYLEIIRNKLLNNSMRNKFCAAVITNNVITDFFRLQFINELSKYKKVDMGGKYKNNVGKIKNKIQFLSSYKFSIAMENTEGDGYISEKIIESFISGTIPIYYGGYMIDEFINPKSFILIRGEKDMNNKIEYIIKIDNNNELYRTILKEKILNKENNNKNEFDEFIFHIFNQDKNKAKRVDLSNIKNY